MVDYAMDIHKSLYGTDDMPEDMVKRRAEVVSRLRSLEEGHSLARRLPPEPARRPIQIGPDQIEALY
ncbi:Eukaryotic translation initiation factor 3 subunit E [Zea mays]|uniref:Eukaryotic translation initiation factor 3 subunit E n=1 Tax=Zea mays TaxID=4577 RepID=A0A3L6D781_MAIZE|nr:Eukaryotic translation initiation factor 3 subunit E [Zea mays]